jgi:hypothetical protein
MTTPPSSIRRRPVSRWNSADIDIPLMRLLAWTGLFNIMPSLFNRLSGVGRSARYGELRRPKHQPRLRGGASGTHLGDAPIEGLSLLTEKNVAVRASAASGLASSAGGHASSRRHAAIRGIVARRRRCLRCLLRRLLSVSGSLLCARCSHGGQHACNAGYEYQIPVHLKLLHRWARYRVTMSAVTRQVGNIAITNALP